MIMVGGGSSPYGKCLEIELKTGWFPTMYTNHIFCFYTFYTHVVHIPEVLYPELLKVEDVGFEGSHSQGLAHILRTCIVDLFSPCIPDLQ